MHGLAKPKNAFATLKRIFSYMHGFKAFMVLSVIGIILSYHRHESVKADNR